MSFGNIIGEGTTNNNMLKAGLNTCKILEKINPVSYDEKKKELSKYSLTDGLIPTIAFSAKYTGGIRFNFAFTLYFKPAFSSSRTTITFNGFITDSFSFSTYDQALILSDASGFFKSTGTQPKNPYPVNFLIKYDGPRVNYLLSLGIALSSSANTESLTSEDFITRFVFSVYESGTEF